MKVIKQYETGTVLMARVRIPEKGECPPNPPLGFKMIRHLTPNEFFLVRKSLLLTSSSARNKNYFIDHKGQAEHSESFETSHCYEKLCSVDLYKITSLKVFI